MAAVLRRSLTTMSRGVMAASRMPRPPTVVSVDADAIRGNVAALRRVVGPNVLLAPAVKQDAYGHGVAKVGAAALDAGADWLCVASAWEAAGVRAAGLSCPLLCMGFVTPQDIDFALAERVKVTVADADVLRAYIDRARELRGKLDVHIKVDTGMGRFGVMPDAAVELAQVVEQHSDCVRLDGVYTHFSVAADVGGDTYTAKQAAVLEGVVASMRQAGVTVPRVHCANSGATLLGQQYHMDMVRPGIATYGLQPDCEGVRLPPELGFRPAMRWTTELASVKTLPAGHTIGYGNTYVTEEECVVGLVPTGYGDGYRRGPANYGHVLVHGVRCPILGRVSMEKTVVGLWPVVGAEPRVGDEVVLLGAQGEEEITVEEAATAAGTNNYEVVTAAVPRVARQ